MIDLKLVPCCIMGDYRDCDQTIGEESMQAKKGDWVMIHNIILVCLRAPQVPDDTKEVP